MWLESLPSPRFNAALLLSFALCGLTLAQQPAWAQTIPSGGNLCSVPATNVTVWTLEGNAFLSDGVNASAAKALPTGTPGLTINGAAGGSTITLNDGAGHFAHFSGTTTALNLSNVILTGGSDANGGVILTTGPLTVNTTGSVSLIGNNASSAGGAINVGTNSLTVNGGLEANGNRAGTFGGVIVAGGNPILITGAVAMNGNIAAGGVGGAISQTTANVSLATVSGNVSLTNNTSTASGSVIEIGTSGNISIGNGSGSITITGNRAGFNSNGTTATTTAEGALHAVGGAVTLNGTTINLSDNIATQAGGGIRAAQAITITGNLTANNNVAQRNIGGAISTSSGGVHINGSLAAAGNTAGTIAGAIFAQAGDVTVTGDTRLTGNIAGTLAGSGTGGAIDAQAGNIMLATTSGDVSLIDNIAATGGGALYAQGAGNGNITVGNSTSTILITGNRAGFNSGGTSINTTSNGGAIYAVSGATTLIGTTITLSNNIATANGGGIYSAQAATVTGNLTANNNAAQNGNGGAIDVQAGGLTINGTLTANSNTSSSVSPNTATKGGGAIYVAAGDVVVTGATSMDANTTAAVNTTTGAGLGPGGAIYAVNGNVRLATTGGNASLTNNSSTGSGGAIFAAGSGKGNVSLGTAGSILTISGNRAGFTPGGTQVGGTASGGAISNTVGTTTLTGDTITITNNKATSNGGAIASLGVVAVGAVTATGNSLTGGNGGVINAGTGGVSITGTLTANKNSAATSGGVIFTTGSVLVTGDVSMDNNVAPSNFNGQGNGGAIAASGNVGLATTSGNVSITNNKGTWSGGGVVVTGNLTVGNAGSIVTITGNQAGFRSDGTLFPGSVAFGGGLRVAGTTTVNGSSITLSNNTASSNGGGICSNNAVTINGNLTANNNTALANANGGAINAQAGGVTINGDLSANSNVAGQGGGINAVAGNVIVTGAVSMDANNAGIGTGGAINTLSGNVSLAGAGGNVSLTNNIAAGNGGAISAIGNVTTGTGSGTVAITGNKAGFNVAGAQLNTTSDGGGVNSSGTTTLAGTAVTVSNNIASRNGGGIFSSQGFNATGDLTLSGNQAVNGSGGGVNVQAGFFTVTGNVTATGNMAGVSGGAIESLPPITLTGDLTASNNVAQTGDGGAVHALGGITVTGGATLNNNLAGNGGGAIGAPGGDVNLATESGDVSLTGNTATAAGGGAILTTNGSVTLGNDSSTVSMTDNRSGANGGAVNSSGSFTMTSGGDSLISGNQAGGLGGALWVGLDTTLNATGGDITFSANTQASGANAIYLDNTSGGTTTTFNALDGRAITFFDPITSNAANGLVSVLKTGAGMVSFDGSQHSALADRSSTVYANTQVQAGTLEIANNAVYGAHAAAVGGSADSIFTTAAGTTLQGGVLGTVIADQFTLGGGLRIAGRQPAIRGVFTIDSNNVTFGPGSQVLFNTVLNNGVVQDTDLLVLNLNGSATSGQASILVNNVGGLGALTVGDGIKLVQTNNGTTAGAFVLGNRVAAGAFEYDLFYGGNPATGGNPDDQNWYLRSELVPRPEVPTVTTLPALANRLGLRLLGTYHERYGGEFPVLAACEEPARGARYTPVADVLTPCSEERRMAMWGRVFGESGETDFGNNVDDFRDHGPSNDFDMGGLQAGLDLLNVRHEDGARDFAGFSVGFASSSADVNGAGGDFAGNSDLDAYLLGGYWTHFGSAGWYVDSVLQGLLYDNGEAESSLGESFGTDGWGLTASLEAGYPFALGDDWTLEPQAQLIYQHVSLSDGKDQFGQIELDDTDVVYGRLGGRLVRYWMTANDLRVSTWLLANVWSDFGEQAQTSFATLDGDIVTKFDTDLGGTWGSFGLGLAGQVSDNMQLFASGEYNTGFDGGDVWSVSGRAGLKIVW